MTEQKVQIHDLSHDGRGVGRTDVGKTCFITGALPDEVVRWSLRKRKQSFDEGICTEVVESSPGRVDPRCPYFGQCGGCELQHFDSASQLEWKERQLKYLFEKSGLEAADWMPPLHVSDWNYRRRTRLAVAYNKKGTVFLGFRARGSSQIVDIEHCDVLEERLNGLLPGLRALAPELKNRGLQEIELTAGDTRLAACFSVKSALSEQQVITVGQYLPGTAIWQKLPGQKATPVFEGKPLQVRLMESIEMEIQPGQFVQVNDAINRAMIQQAIEWLKPEASHNLLDLFCGAGNFSLAFAPRVKSVLGVEGSYELCQQAQNNARRNKLLNLEFRSLDLFDAGKFSKIGEGPFDQVVLDPPRAGAEALMPWLARIGPEKILYISCHPATMVRDIQALDKNYSIEKVGAMNMFPHTTHLEAMTLLVKK